MGTRIVSFPLRVNLTLILVFGLGPPGTLSAQAPLVDSPVSLADGPLACDPVDPVLAALPEASGGDGSAGGFVAAWSDRQVFVQRFDGRSAARSPRLRMGSQAGPRQIRPAVAVTPDGRSAVAWIEPAEGLLRASLFSPRGLAVNRSELAAGVDAAASLALTSAGADRFVAVWEQGDGLGFVRFGSTGLEATQELVSGTAGCRLRSPALAPDRAPDSDGGVVLAWLEECPGPAPSQLINARRLDRFGLPMGPLMGLSGVEPPAPTGGPAVATDLAADEIVRLDAGRAFVDRRDANVAQRLRSARLFAVAHAAVHLDAGRVDVDAREVPARAARPRSG